MARTNKVGIDYFSFDVNFFNDDKIQLIEAEFGVKGSIIAIRLLCKIYNEGYFYRWGEDQCLLFAKNSGSEFTPEIVQNIVNGLIRRSFFDANCYEKYHVLTSSGIQRRYLDATDRYKEVKLIEEYLLVDTPVRDNISIIKINVDINSNNEYINPQRKGNRKEKEKEIEIKGEEIEISNTDTAKNINDIYPFEEFWNDYDKKVGDKTKLKKKWEKLSDKDKHMIKDHIPLYKKSQPDKKFRKNPETFINNQSWNDEIITNMGNNPAYGGLKVHPMVDHSNEKVYEQF